MTEVKTITITLVRPNPPSFHGKVAVGHYKVEDDTVLLTDRVGNPVDRYRLSQKLGPGNDPQGVACNLLRFRYSSQSGGSFNRPLIYPKVKF